MAQLLEQILQRFGTPCFVYDFDQVRMRIAALRQAFASQFRISYAVKANPQGAILQRLRNGADLLDISSGGELRLALAAGWPGELMSFTGPAKRDAELQAAVEHRIGHVVVEGILEAQRLQSIAAQQGVRQNVLIRIAPARVPAGFGSRMAGKPSQFGIDEEEIDDAVEQIRKLDRLDLRGFHVYSGTQCLSASAIAENYLMCIELFRRIAQGHELNCQALIFGSGLGIPYHDNDQPLDLAAVAQQVNPALAKLHAQQGFTDCQFILETGRYLVGEAGLYLTRIISAKRSRGAQIRICDGGMNHHLGACGHLGSVLHRNFRMFKVGHENPRPQELQSYDLFGPLCTSIDNLAHDIKLPALEVGDVVGIHCSGAYGLTASPGRFISHDPAKEILVETVGGQRTIVDISEPTRSIAHG